MIPAEPAVLRLAAFPADPADHADRADRADPADGAGGEGGNPAGVVLDAGALDAAAMQGIAAEIGYAETAFVVERLGERGYRMRYFSPDAEVPFCGHATIATAVVLAERQGAGPFVFETAVGEVAVETRTDEAGRTIASFTSVEPRVRALPAEDTDALLALLGLTHEDLDARYAPAEAFAGNPHPVLVIADPAVFDGFTFDPAAVRVLMDDRGWTGTVTILHIVDEGTIDARNLFPVGAITEDPATGSAAAAVGGWLRATGAVVPPARITVHQGRHVGRPSVLLVDIPSTGGITVSGTAHRIL